MRSSGYVGAVVAVVVVEVVAFVARFRRDAAWATAAALDHRMRVDADEAVACAAALVVLSELNAILSHPSTTSLELSRAARFAEAWTRYPEGVPGVRPIDDT